MRRDLLHFARGGGFTATGALAALVAVDLILALH
jgi:hypothetical protein